MGNSTKFIPKIPRSSSGVADKDGCFFFMDTLNGDRLTSVDEDGNYTVYCQCNGIDWMANASQSGTGAPTLSGVQVNSDSVSTPTAARLGAGDYTLTFDVNLFSVSYYHYFYGNTVPLGHIALSKAANNILSIKTFDLTGAPADNILNNSLIKFNITGK